MKRFTLFLIAVLLLAAGCKSAQEPRVMILSDDMVFPESVLMYDSTLLVVNFGTDELDPLNTEGRGFILGFAESDSTSFPFLRANGVLSAPKGTRIRDEKLYVADVGKLVVFDLDNLRGECKVFPLPEEDVYANDLDFHGSTLYLTVTNTGNVYKWDTALEGDSLRLAFTVPGANGILIDGNTAYVASYPPDETVTDANTLYRIEDLSDPVPVKLIDRPGQYDGLALSEEGTKLYFTNWIGGEVASLDLQTLEVEPIDTGDIIFSGPARLICHEGYLYVPDLVESRVVRIKL